MFSASTFLCLTLIAASVPVLSAPIPGARDLCDGLTGLDLTACIDHDPSAIPIILPPTSDPTDIPAPPPSSIASAAPPSSPTPCVIGPDCLPFEHLPVVFPPPIVRPTTGGINTGGPIVLPTTGGINTGGPVVRPTSGGIATRGLASIIEGLVGPGNIEHIIGRLFGGSTSGTTATSTDTSAASDASPISARQLAGIAEKLIPGIVNGVASTVGSVAGGGIESILGKLFNRRAFVDLSDGEVNQLLEYINGNKREIEVRFTLPAGVTSGIGKALGENLTSAALGGLEKLFGFGSDSATTAATPTPSA
ncbi:hypothetical protein C8R44DRAFT_70642 [Mycena epipterygia]|nr:hypothetical protein C8R44DRAFT_70642 [Mycena epipterygia]